MKTQVIRFVESEIQSGNEVIISTCGNGGAGLTLISDIMLVQELKEMKYVGSNQPAEDIENYEDYDPEAYNVHRFNGGNGFYILVATYGINASKPVEDINNLSDTIMDINFINGKSIIKSGRKIIAKVYYRPEFFKGTDVNWDTRYPYCLEMNGMAAQCATINEVVELFQSEI